MAEPSSSLAPTRDRPILDGMRRRTRAARREFPAIASDVRAPGRRRRRRRCRNPDHPGPVPGMRRTRREYLGAPADVPDVRARRLLRLQPARARQPALPRDRSPRHAVGGARRELAVVLRRHPAGLTVWQGGRAMTEHDRATVRTVLLLGAGGHRGRELALAFERLGAAVARGAGVRRTPTRSAPLLDEHRPDYVVAVSADVPPAALHRRRRAGRRRGVPDAARHPAQRRPRGVAQAGRRRARAADRAVLVRVVGRGAGRRRRACGLPAAGHPAGGHRSPTASRC